MVKYLPILCALLLGAIAGYGGAIITTPNHPMPYLSDTRSADASAQQPITTNDSSNIASTLLLSTESDANIPASVELSDLAENPEDNDIANEEYVIPLPKFNKVNQRNVDMLLDDIDVVASQEGDDNYLELLANTEIDFLQQIDRSPELLEKLLRVYPQLADGGSKELLRSLLTATGQSVIEQTALAALGDATVDNQTQWLLLLRDLGVNTTQSRQSLIDLMPVIVEPHLVATAISAFVPVPLPREEKAPIVDWLYEFTVHENAQIRSAGVEALSGWVDKNSPEFLEQALLDDSPLVRQSAIRSAFTSGIQSTAIKSELLWIMQDESEPFDLRMDAYDTLQAYALEDTEHDQVHDFYLQLNELNQDTGEAKG